LFTPARGIKQASSTEAHLLIGLPINVGLRGTAHAPSCPRHHFAGTPKVETPGNDYYLRLLSIPRERDDHRRHRRPESKTTGNKMKVLVAEDSQVYQKLLLNHLGDWGFESIPVKDGDEAWNLLQASDSPKLALIDWVLPGMDGLEICRRLRRDRNRPYVYTILLTAKDRKDELIEGLEAGADDYLIKPFDSQELRVRLQTGFRLVRVQEELIAAQTALRELASHDSLTGIWNRRKIFDFLQRELLRAKRQRQPVSVIMVDVDNFKKVNDSMGHLAGDSVLVEVAHRLRVQLRAYDGVGRYGGEEFLLVLPACDFMTAKERAEELRRAIVDSPILAARTPVQITVSLGVSGSDNGEIAPEALLDAADSSLYKAKQLGRNRVEGTVLFARIDA
jgi:two-component system cell cycle response regulator